MRSKRAGRKELAAHVAGFQKRRPNRSFVIAAFLQYSDMAPINQHMADPNVGLLKKESDYAKFDASGLVTKRLWPLRRAGAAHRSLIRRSAAPTSKCWQPAYPALTSALSLGSNQGDHAADFWPRLVEMISGLSGLSIGLTRPGRPRGRDGRPATAAQPGRMQATGLSGSRLRVGDARPGWSRSMRPRSRTRRRTRCCRTESTARAGRDSPRPCDR